MTALHHWKCFGWALCALFLLAGGTARAQVAVFGFESVPLATPTPLLGVAADNGAPLTGDFVSLGNGAVAEPDAFFIGQNDEPGNPPLFGNMSGHILMQPTNFDTAGFDTLQIRLSAPVSSISLNFALFDADSLRLDAFTLGNPNGLLGTTSVPGVLDPLTGFFEGTLSFDGAGKLFDTVTLHATDRVSQFFALDNVTVAGPAVPEPGALAFCLAVAGPLLWRLRRRAR